MNKLALGTVQFGLNYGIANKIGQISFDDAKEILKYAKNKNIDLIDTAISYGESEKVIGDVGIQGFKFITKLSVPPNDHVNIHKWIEEKISLSLERLGIESLYGLLIHRSENLFGVSGKKIINTLNKLKSKGMINKIGVSIYEPSELEKLKDIVHLDLIQAPFSIFDQRLLSSGWLSKLFKNDTEVHVRSVFLQGLLLMSKENRSAKFNKWNNLWKIWHEWLNDNQITALEATIRFALSKKEISKVVVGVDSKDQLEQIISASDGKLPAIPSELSLNDVNLLNPSNWSKI